jgi:hypothetical protein
MFNDIFLSYLGWCTAEGRGGGVEVKIKNLLPVW